VEPIERLRQTAADEQDRTLADTSEPSGPHRLADRLRCPTCGESQPADYAVCPRDATPLRRAPSEVDPLIGIVLSGTYRIERVIGKGGMGRLYEAHHARIGRRFAVKVLVEAHRERRDATRRFEREADVLSRIDSAHVLDVVDVLAVPDGRTAIITSLLEGEDLQRRLDRTGTVPVAEAVALARMICRGLAAAHAVGVVHRDLKPSNLFLTAGQGGGITLKILDFGVAKLTDEREVTKAGVVLGTPAYMAPEQARGSHDADERSDLYAVGAVLYRMVTGRMPYDGRDATETLSQLLAGPPPRPRSLRRDVPEALEQVIQLAMAREPADRPRSAFELDALLGAVDPASSPSALASGASAVPRRKDGRAPEEGTLVLPRGAVAQAKDLERSARRARPAAVGWALAGSLFVGALGGAAIRPLGGLASEDAAGPLASALAIVGTLAGGAAFAHRARTELAARWSSAPEIDVWNRRVGPSLVRSLAALGLMTSALGAWTTEGHGGLVLGETSVALMALAAFAVLEGSLGSLGSRVAGWLTRARAGPA
jgi:serine/threonine protein kinase